MARIRISETRRGRNVFARMVLAAVQGMRRGLAVGKTKKGKGLKLMLAADGEGIPLDVQRLSAAPNEVRLIKSTLDAIRVPKIRRGRQGTKFLIV